MKVCLGHRIMAISLVFMLMISSTGFSMHVHFCHDQLSGISFLSKAKCCKQKASACRKDIDPCQQSDIDDHQHDENCCNDKKITIDHLEIDAVAHQAEQLKDISIEYVAIYTFLVSWQVDFQLLNEVPDRYYNPPPPPERDVQAMFQSFLL